MRPMLTRRDVTVLLRIAGVVVVAINLHRAYFAWGFWAEARLASAKQSAGILSSQEVTQSWQRLIEAAWAPLAGVLLVVGASLLSRVVMLALPSARGCSSCGYDLTGVSGAVCPECGSPRDAGRQA